MDPPYYKYMPHILFGIRNILAHSHTCEETECEDCVEAVGLGGVRRTARARVVARASRACRVRARVRVHGRRCAHESLESRGVPRGAPTTVQANEHLYTRVTVRKQQSTQDWTGLERRVHILGLDDALRGCRPRLHGAEARVRAAEAARDVGAVGVGLARRPMLLGHALPRG